MKSILFSPIMILALLEKIKSQTRRSQGLKLVNSIPSKWKCLGKNGNGDFLFFDLADQLQHVVKPVFRAGDVLYVKEEHYRFGIWEPDGDTKTGRAKWVFTPMSEDVFYSDAPPAKYLRSRARVGCAVNPHWYKRNSLFMPEHCARIYINIGDLKVERSSEISESDCINEGIVAVTKDGNLYKYCVNQFDSKQSWADMPRTAKDAFRNLWISINGNETWGDWVFAYSFSQIDKP